MITERLYYNDSFLTSFDARVVDTQADGLRVYLDRTAFYPESGGQPDDAGTLNGVRVVQLVDEGEQIAHLLEQPLNDTHRVTGRIDWTRRFDHMQQHTGQHLLSAVIAARTGVATVSFHLGPDVSTIDLDVSAVTPEQAIQFECWANEAITQDDPVRVWYDEAATVQGLRKASQRDGLLRIVEIEGLDRSACGGTHVKSTGQLGMLAIRKIDRIRGQVRLEFVCGRRAADRARLDQDALTQIARIFSVGLDQAPTSAKAAVDRLATAEKALRKLEGEAAERRGRELYYSLSVNPAGLRVGVRKVDTVDELVRQEAGGFTRCGADAVFLAIGTDPAALLLAASAKGVDCGKVLKQALEGTGGRGGGGATQAQGSVPDAARLGEIQQRIEAALSSGNAG